MYPDGREILLVVDDADRRERVARILAAEGFTVTPAADALAALRALAARHYALIIAAIDLPGSFDGPAIVHWARRQRPAIKALYLTDGACWPALADPDRDDLIATPCERWELIGCTFELLERGAPTYASGVAWRIRSERRAS
jgi:two-component system, OmpR family, phosphate regulon response regulator OmpR